VSNVPKTYSIKVTEGQMELEESTLENNAAEGVIIGDLWGYISDVNQVIVNMYGAKDKSEFIGKNVLEFLVKEERDRAVKSSLDSIATEKAKTHQYRVQLKDGKQITVEVTSDFLRNKQGDIIGLIEIMFYPKIALHFLF
jgi:PAS domain S-box-containing protein